LYFSPSQTFFWLFLLKHVPKGGLGVLNERAQNKRNREREIESESESEI
jgi:hypothetical protein